MGRNGGTSYNETVSHSTTRGRSQTLAPVYRTLPSAVYSLQEQQYRAAAGVRNLPKQTAIVKPPFAHSVRVTVPMVTDGYARSERVERFREQVFEKSGVMATRAEVEAEIERRRQDLERRAAGPKERAPVEPDDFLE